MPTYSRTIPGETANERAKFLCRWLADAASEWTSRPESRERVEQVFAGIDWRDVSAVAKRAEEWAKRHIAYNSNPFTAQIAPTPEYVWRNMKAPCTAAALVAGLILGTANRVRLVLWGRYRHFTHVFVEVWDEKADAWRIVDWVPQEGFRRTDLTRGLRWTHEVRPDDWMRPGRAFVQCAVGERFPKLAGIVSGIADLPADWNELARMLQENLDKVQARVLDDLQDRLSHVAKVESKAIANESFKWLAVALIATSAGYLLGTWSRK